MKTLLATLFLLAGATATTLTFQEPVEITTTSFTSPESEVPAEATALHQNTQQTTQNEVTTSETPVPARDPSNIPATLPVLSTTQPLEMVSLNALQRAVEAIRNQDSPGAKEDARAQAREAMREMYDRRLEAYTRRIDEMESSLKQMKKLLQKRKEAAERIIELRLQLIEAEADGLIQPGSSLISDPFWNRLAFPAVPPLPGVQTLVPQTMMPQGSPTIPMAPRNIRPQASPTVPTDPATGVPGWPNLPQLQVPGAPTVPTDSNTGIPSWPSSPQLEVPPGAPTVPMNSNPGVPSWSNSPRLQVPGAPSMPTDPNTGIPSWPSSPRLQVPGAPSMPSATQIPSPEGTPPTPTEPGIETPALPTAPVSPPSETEPEPVARTSTATVHLRAADGFLFKRIRIEGLMFGREVLFSVPADLQTITLPEGKYAYDVELDGGRKATGSFDAGYPDSATVLIKPDEDQVAID